MKKIKVVFNSIAIIAALGAALATRYYTQQQDKPQYIPINNTYQPTGEYGVDYNCYDSDKVCTYYQADSASQPGEYVPAKRGWYVPVKK
jgi:hypothetical protein